MIAQNLGSPRFRPGDLVQHRRYGYRGVVVAVDPYCRASEGWYMANRTQPERNQPWYHVLVDGSRSATYAAQTSLKADSEGGPIEHPLVDHFFSAFTGDAYVRNDQPAWGTP